MAKIFTYDEGYSDSYKIWFERYDPRTGREYGSGVLPYGYTRKCDATRMAKKRFGDNPNVKYYVSKTNPWVNEPVDPDIKERFDKILARKIVEEVLR